MGHSGYVSALAASGSDLYAGGAFSTASGKNSAYLARAALVVPSSPPLLSSPALAGGVFTIWSTNSSSATFRGPGATDPNQPLSSWLPVGRVEEVTPEAFQFTDPQAGNTGQRYARVQWPGYAYPD